MNTVPAPAAPQATQAHEPLADLLRRGPYQAYSYSYPHKSAYRAFPQPRALEEQWARQDRRALFAYVHLPFCTMRCGFCNLFAMAQPQDDLVERYVQAIVRQMRVMRGVLGEHRYARLALGGGTPSYLSAAQLETVYDAAATVLGVDLQATPSGIEVSPETVTRDRLAVCRAAGVTRVSMGVQSFSQDEVRELARPQQNAMVEQAIADIRHFGFEVLNLDLIYGIAGQTVASWLASLDSALAHAPEELYLYPLYVRRHTGLDKLAIRRATPAGDHRAALYAAGRDHLLRAGYVQVSMRMFRAPHARADDGPAYCCQNDGMVGLGAGARSYAGELHYSSHYAVERAATRGIVEDYIACDERAHAQARYGFELDAGEQRRRFVIQSLLAHPGLSPADYAQRFGSACAQDLPQLAELSAAGLMEEAAEAGGRWRLTAEGQAQADAIGPWLASPRVRRLMDERQAPC